MNTDEASIREFEAQLPERATDEPALVVDVEGFEIEVLRGCARALSERRIGLIQLEWNAQSLPAVGTDRRPVADLLARCGYQLYRPDPQGRLVPVIDLNFGSDVFARPALEEASS